jgi:hypothetical protein
MRLARYVKFREEKFGGVLFETRSEKVYTLNPTAAAVLREIQSGRPKAIRDRLKERYTAEDMTRSIARSPRSSSTRQGTRRGLTSRDRFGIPAVAVPATTPAATSSGDPGAPLYVA